MFHVVLAYSRNAELSVVRGTVGAMDNKRASYETTARQAAEHILGVEAIPFAPQRMSKYAHWYEDVDQNYLVAVANLGEKYTAGDEVLAFGLAWQQNRDLILVLPEVMVIGALTRIPWIGTVVRLWQFDGEGDPRPIAPLARAEVLAKLRALPSRGSAPYALRPEHDAWIDGINTDGLVAHQRSCLSWHHEGLQVLRVTDTINGVRIQAGVQYSTPPAGREPYDNLFGAAPTHEDLAVINARVREAVGDDGSLTSQMREHKMQSTLCSQPEALRLARLWREYPGYRGLKPSGGGRTGFIDFLGADDANALQVVETKIGHDVTVVLQALDYAIWVKANEDSIRESLLPGTETMEESGQFTPSAIHLVLGSKGREPAFNGYLAGQIEALSGDLRVNIHLTDDPAGVPLDLRLLPTRRMWQEQKGVAAPVRGPRWPEQVLGALIEAER